MRACVTAAYSKQAFCLDYRAERISHQAQSSLSMWFVSGRVFEASSGWFISSYQCERKHRFLTKAQELTARTPSCLHQLHSKQQHSEHIQVVKSTNLSVRGRKRQSATLASSAKILTRDLDSIIPHTQIFTHLILSHTTRFSRHMRDGQCGCKT